MLWSRPDLEYCLLQVIVSVLGLSLVSQRDQTFFHVGAKYEYKTQLELAMYRKS